MLLLEHTTQHRTCSIVTLTAAGEPCRVSCCTRTERYGGPDAWVRDCALTLSSRSPDRTTPGSIDCGTQSVKALLYDPVGHVVVGRGSAPLSLSTPRPGAAEQEPEAWLQARPQCSSS